jgi:DNA-binding transcriptional LysR family regulator
VILACSRQYYETYVQGDESFTSLSRQNFISYRKDLHTIKQWFKHHFSKANIQVRDVLTVDSHGAVISAITSNVGMGIVASHLIAETLRKGTVVHIQTSKAEIMNSIALVHLQDKIPTFTEKVFERFLVDMIRGTISTDNAGMKVLCH